MQDLDPEAMNEDPKLLKFQIRKFLGSFRYRKFANFLGVPVLK
jgi:hypothetical protein